MALFGNSKKTTKKKAGVKPAGSAVKDSENKLAGALLTPWLSEKALIATEKGVYTFRIPMTATKKDVTLAVEKYYKVTPRQVRVVNLPAKKVSLRKRRGFGMKSAQRKAYVFLKKGETIQFA
ncbi:MAG: 50S ribosomal protein L23 [Candidatus Pacebacteria bacterium]|nr:50S ribosomal protein L23 [Candidatus Paceibacterota bacterium]MBP9840162.1 50S ribosomal protein L23 [Candidatus Paceibacterota bacterium]